MEKPRIFLGSSGKQAKLLQALTRGLEDVANVEPWTTTFNPGVTTLERLLELTREVDFAAFVFAQDDWTTNAPAAEPATATGQACPRDNVVFEAGLFGGVLGMRRTFILHASGAKHRRRKRAAPLRPRCVARSLLLHRPRTRRAGVDRGPDQHHRRPRRGRRLRRPSAATSPTRNWPTSLGPLPQSTPGTASPLRFVRRPGRTRPRRRRGEPSRRIRLFPTIPRFANRETFRSQPTR